MSEPRYVVGSEVRACSMCGTSVEHSISLGMYGSGPESSATKHDAPCGLPCLGGGVGSNVIKPMRAAGKKLRDVCHAIDTCPRCSTSARWSEHSPGVWNLDAGDSAAQVVVAEFGIAWRTFTDGDWSEFDYTASTIEDAILAAGNSIKGGAHD